MKGRMHIQILVTTVLCSLLFTQVGAGFFHNQHDAHKETHILGAGQYALQEHGEHCKVCSIDLIHLFSESFSVTIKSGQDNFVFITPVAGIPSTVHSFLRGRAPPVC
jgi:hypothetical protein